MATDVTTQTIQPAIPWHSPILFPERGEAPPLQVNSKEKVAQTTRMASVTPVRYASEYDVPGYPTPLSDVEQALDMTSQSSTVTQMIPFFVTQTPANASAASTPAAQLNASLYPTSQPHTSSTGAASAEMVQALGLPMFLIGQNIQALQTVAATPSLLSTFVDGNGMYDQVRLTSLVQTLGQGSSSAPNQQHAKNPSSMIDSALGSYNPEVGSGNGVYGPASTGGGGGYRGAQNSGDGNLHLSGYGPTTTQSEIIALFSPYVMVDEVVMKTTFCFVNTSDPVGAKRAREALNGALLGGQPVRINPAQRKNRDAQPGADLFGNSTQSIGSYYGHQNTIFAPPTGGASSFGQPPPPPSIPGQAPPVIGGDVSHIRDDRGNPATKNLFVAGYGQGTSETLLRQVFSPLCEIVGIIMKGNFSFINTADKTQAVHAREFLSGTLLNGGVLRINFAKESGRLGTSFDLTYGNKAQPHSHYGPRDI
jgi:RNA recognition motif-containing protein